MLGPRGGLSGTRHRQGTSTGNARGMQGREDAMTSFPEMFKTATGYAPYAYQVQFATRNTPPALVSVPTGFGGAARERGDGG